MIVLNIFLSFAAALLWAALIVEKDSHKQMNFTFAFGFVLAFAFAINFIS